MRTKLFSLLLFAFGMMLTSCNFTETITVNPDGTGEMALVMDGAKLMEKAGDKMGKEAEKKIDTTISFKSLFAQKKDSIATLSAEQQQAFKNLERYEMHLKMDAKEKKMLLTMKTDFKSAAELSDMMGSMGELSKLKNGNKGGAMSLQNEKSKTSFVYDGATFKKTVLFDKKSLKGEEADEFKQTMEMYRGMFGQCTYTMIYKFPKKIKKVSDKNAQLSEDKTTVTIQHSFMDYLENPDKLSLRVDFEK